MFECTRRDGVTQFARPEARWLVTGPDGGYVRTDASYNVTVPAGFDREDLRTYGAERRERSGFDRDGPTLFTGVDQRHVRGARAGPVAVYATAGLSNPANMSMSSSGSDTTDESWRPGTVNVVAGTTRALDDGAMATLLGTVVEAKTATLQATVGFTGTTSDAVVVGCDPTGEPAVFAGSATPVGAAVRNCVRDALVATLSARYADDDPPESVEAATYGVVSSGETDLVDSI